MAATTPQDRSGRPSSMFGRSWLDRRTEAVLAVAVTVAYGFGAGWSMPRGPVTTAEALTALGAGLAVGAFAGLVLRSRWAVVLAPVTFVVVFELTRISTAGPFVDGMHLTSTYGVIAFVLGRGLHGVLTLAPMVLGALLGAGTARRMRDAPPVRSGWSGIRLRTRRFGAAVLALSLIVLTAGIIRPAHTDAIAGGVAELSRVRIGGHDLTLMIRGDSVDDPVLLYLAGGPGGTDIGGMRRHGQQLEQAFVVATFDQRGTGKSYDSLDPTSTLTLATAISDTVEVVNHLRARFDQDKIYVVGNSWGSLLGVLVAQQHPELVRAFIGSGQMVSPRDTDRIFYDDTLAWARSTGNSALVEQLTGSGPPPYTDMLDYESALTYEHQVYPYDDTLVAEPAAGFTSNLFVGEYTLMEQVHNLAGFFDVFTVLYPQLQGIDFRTQVRRLEVPVYLVQGRHEARGRAEPADAWFQLLDAPTKTKIVFERSGHRALFQQPDQFYQFMTGTVLRQTKPDLTHRRKVHPMAEARTGGGPAAGVLLYWLPLGAGGRSVRWNGRLFEALVARHERRAVQDLYHSALEVHVGDDRFVVEMTPAWGAPAADRGVVLEGPVGARWLGRSVAFRYEIRRWRTGVIPDIADAVGGPRQVSRDLAQARRLLDLVPAVPAVTWGRDELHTGDMWNSNSLTAWLLARSGHDTDDLSPPTGGRAPGWNAGLIVAAREQHLRARQRP